MTIDSLGDWKRTHYSTEIATQLDGREVILFGWVQDLRDLGKILFMTVRDKNGVVQITVPKAKASKELLERISRMGKQFAVGVKGVVHTTKEAPQGVEVVPSEVKILGEVSYPLPLDPTGRVPAEIDVRLNARILDLRRPEPMAIFKVRNEVLIATRNFLDRQRFVEIHTPRLIVSATEGGAALFPVEYFEGKAYLAQSPQLYKEQLVTVFEKVYEIGPFFRAEEHDTRRHANEFTSVDIEQAFSTSEDVMKALEQLMYEIVVHVTDSCTKELKVLGANPLVPMLPLTRYTYDEILRELKLKGQEVAWGEDIPTPAYRALQELRQKQFYFIVDWPTKAKAFYIKPRENNPELSYGFDFMYEWVEIASGGSRIDRKEMLVERLKEKGLNPDTFQDHLKAFDYGMPPHAGWAFGLERLLMALLGIENIREVTLFPRDRYRLTP